MRKLFLNKQFYAIHDGTNNGKVSLKKLQGLLKSGIIGYLQYRNKTASSRVAYQQAKYLRKLSRRYQVPFIINDSYPLARRVKADGVHLGQTDSKYQQLRHYRNTHLKIIGKTCHSNIALAFKAVRIGADYIALGALFPSRNKPKASQLTPRLCRIVKARITKPIVVIGGINQNNLHLAQQTKADYYAMIDGLAKLKER